MDHSSASALFRAVADPARLRLLHLLQAEELSVGELVRIIDLPQSSVSRHLKALRDESLVIDRAAGPATYYRAALPGDHSNGQGRLRQALTDLLPGDQLPLADRRRLEQVLALRAGSGTEFFDRIGLQWDALRESCFGSSFHLEAFLTLLPAEWTVADLGTGTGYLLPHLARHFRKVIAVDSSPAMLDQAARTVREAEAEGPVSFYEGRLEKLPVKSATVDLALAILMLHHLTDLPSALQEISRITRPGGQVLIVDFESHSNVEFQRRMADEKAGLNPHALTAALKEAGFIEIRYQAIGQPQLPDHELAPLPRLYAITARRAGAQTNIKAATQRPKNSASITTGRKHK